MIPPWSSRVAIQIVILIEQTRAGGARVFTVMSSRCGRSVGVSIRDRGLCHVLYYSASSVYKPWFYSTPRNDATVMRKGKGVVMRFPTERMRVCTSQERETGQTGERSD